MSWSWDEARLAARRVKTAESGREALSVVRPRQRGGFIRDRAPLALFLYVASRSGFVVGASERAFAVIQPPAIHQGVPPVPARDRLLRRVDRHWGFVAAFGPCVLCLLAALLLAVSSQQRVISVLLVLLGMLWLTSWMLTQTLRDVSWVRGLGRRSTRKHGRMAESLPAYHWSSPLIHLPDLDETDHLLQELRTRLASLVTARAQASVGGSADVEAQVTEELVVLTAGVTTEAARSAISRSLRVHEDFSEAGDVILLAPPARRVTPADVPEAGGAFLLYYLGAVVIVVLVAAVLVSGQEADACAATSCTGHPATWSDAVRWLMQRLLFTDPPNLTPLTMRVTVLGWLVSLMGAMTLPVAFVAARAEIRQNKQTARKHDQELTIIMDRARVLLLVVSRVEREAVLDAMRAWTGHEALRDASGSRTAWNLGRLDEDRVEVFLGQAGEQGTTTTGGMSSTARELIAQVRPNIVVLTGICYGLGPYEVQSIGDVVVARRVQDRDHQKETPAGIIPRGINVPPTPSLLDRFQAAETTWTSTAAARVHIGTVLSSNTLVDSRALVSQLRDQFPDAIAGEMEGIGLYHAVSEGTKPDWIIVKGISDWGYDKTKEHQALAAGNAADFVAHTLAGGRLRQR